MSSHNKVIVVFKDGTPDEEIQKAMDDVTKQGGIIGHRYTDALLGFSATMPDMSVQTLSTHPQLDYIEPDGEVSIYAKELMK